VLDEEAGEGLDVVELRVEGGAMIGCHVVCVVGAC
jgi:hypothetical protein